MAILFTFLPHFRDARTLGCLDVRTRSDARMSGCSDVWTLGRPDARASGHPGVRTPTLLIFNFCGRRGEGPSRAAPSRAGPRRPSPRRPQKLRKTNEKRTKNEIWVSFFFPPGWHDKRPEHLQGLHQLSHHVAVLRLLIVLA